MGEDWLAKYRPPRTQADITRVGKAAQGEVAPGTPPTQFDPISKLIKDLGNVSMHSLANAPPLSHEDAMNMALGTMTVPEKVVAAAIKAPGELGKKWINQSKGVAAGFEGGHSAVMNDILEHHGGQMPQDWADYTHGFVTDKGNFVGRLEAENMERARRGLPPKDPTKVSLANPVQGLMSEHMLPNNPNLSLRDKVQKGLLDTGYAAGADIGLPFIKP
jgi:hypothetical protein